MSTTAQLGPCRSAVPHLVYPSAGTPSRCEVAKLVAKLVGVCIYEPRPAKALGSLIGKRGFGAWRPKHIYAGVRIGEAAHPGPNLRKAALTADYRRKLKSSWVEVCRHAWIKYKMGPATWCRRESTVNKVLSSYIQHLFDTQQRRQLGVLAIMSLQHRIPA